MWENTCNAISMLMYEKKDNVLIMCAYINKNVECVHTYKHIYIVVMYKCKKIHKYF